MEETLYFFVFLLGSCLSSFINVVIYRVPLKISFIKGRSFCPSCHHQLHILDLIPVISYLYLGGQCRYCHEHIGIRDTILEILGGIVAIICFFKYGVHCMTILSFTFAMLLQAIAFIDLDTKKMPKGLIIGCFFLGFLSIPYNDITIIDRFIAVILSSFSFLVEINIFQIIKKEDLQLLAAGGFFMGCQNIFIAMFIAAGIYVIYLWLTHQVNRNSCIFFGPCLCISILIVLLFG